MALSGEKEAELQLVPLTNQGGVASSKRDGATLKFLLPLPLENQCVVFHPQSQVKFPGSAPVNFANPVVATNGGGGTLMKNQTNLAGGEKDGKSLKGSTRRNEDSRCG